MGAQARAQDEKPDRADCDQQEGNRAGLALDDNHVDQQHDAEHDGEHRQQPMHPVLLHQAVPPFVSPRAASRNSRADPTNSTTKNAASPRISNAELNAGTIPAMRAIAAISAT